MARISVPGYTGPHPPSPRAVVRVSGGEVYLAETLTPRIEVVSVIGGVAWEITREMQDSSNPRAALSLVRDSARARGGSGAPETISERLLRTDDRIGPEGCVFEA